MGKNLKQQYINHLQTALSYQFKNIKFLNQALTHRSHASNNNERLEFIGDSILNYVIAKMLYDTFPHLNEGRLSPLRAQLVKESTLADIARELNLGPALNLGIGEMKSGGADRSSILADALEALFAAISLDSDFQNAQRVIQHLFSQRIQKINTRTVAKDAKSTLQEYLQARRLSLPKYRIEQQTGEGNHIFFEISCDLGELGYMTRASGSSRRAAEQIAAQQALDWLKQQDKKKKTLKS